MNEPFKVFDRNTVKFNTIQDSDKNRFWRNVEKSDYCWNWRASKNAQGYGAFYFKGQTRRAHRISWTIFNGEIENGVCVLHKCDNPTCVNPEHLWLGDDAMNASDKVKKGRCNPARGDLHPMKLNPDIILRGKNHPGSILNDEQVLEIRERYIKGVFGFKKLAKCYGVTPSNITCIILRKTWIHI